LFNLGSALAFVQPPSQWCLYWDERQGMFNWNNVRKNKQTGQFEELNQTDTIATVY
jgi:L-asparaginase